MQSRTFSGLPVVGLLTLVYFIAGKFGLILASLHASASPVWPPAGIALAALLVLGYRAWPAIFVGAFLVNVTTVGDRKSTRLNSSHGYISYAVFCLKKKISNSKSSDAVDASFSNTSTHRPFTLP